MTDTVTTIIVTPLDRKAPGGFRQYQRVRRFMLRGTQAQKSNDVAASLEADVEIEDWVLSRCRTSDGSPLDEALDGISYEDYLGLFKAALGEPSVDPLKTGSSLPPSEAATASPTGS